MSQACLGCLRRSWLLARLSGHLELARGRLEEALALSDQDLIDALAGALRGDVLAEYARLDETSLRAHSDHAGLELICRCDAAYPASLRTSTAAPAVLHVGGGLERFLSLLDQEPVAIVGARRPSEYGLEMARALARGLASAGIPVISGMAIGIDAAAHAGALAASGSTLAVLPCGANRPYPSAKRALYKQIRSSGGVVSELPADTPVRRWTFRARNRIIAALGAMTVVVEAGEKSGALVTATYARELRRPLGAVPGRVTSPLAAGPNRLLGAGAEVIRGAQDVLDALFGHGARQLPARARARLEPDLERLLAAIGDGADTIAALARAGLEAESGLAALSALELAGYVRREAGGRFSVLP
jgi:DNA processing protein